MYILPNTNVKILKNVPLDNSYTHTIFFNSLEKQFDFFELRLKFNVGQNTYQRVNTGKLRIEINSENLYDCNYLMFQNASFGNKWFYAFITSVEYVNNITSEISFEIDVMQTWHFDYALQQCFVVREHPRTDNIGDNLQPEPVNVGEYIYNGFTPSGAMSEPCIVLVSNVSTSGEQVNGSAVGGIWQGQTYNIYSMDVDGWIKIRERLSSFSTWDELNENVTACFMYDLDYANLNVIRTTEVFSKTVTKSKAYGSLSGYTPRNKKLYTYPYNYLLVTTDSGDAIEYKYEFFSGSACQFKISGNLTPNPQMVCDPLDYKNTTFLRNERLTLSGFPQCTYNIDSFKAWLAQTASNPDILVGAVNSAIEGGQSGGAKGAAAGAASSLAGTVLSGVVAYAKPPEVHGSVHSDCSYAMGTKDFYFFPAHAHPDYLRRIDGFFDVYGYAINQHKIPERSSRPHWNYVETKETNLTGSVPADDSKKIISIYEQGITFWKNGDEIGNYSLDNSPR